MGKNSIVLIPRSSGCIAPELNRFVTDYCFADLSENERSIFEGHLLDCDFCWAEVQRLVVAVSSLRREKDLTRHIVPAHLAAEFGISAKLDWPWAGHGIHVLISSGIYGLAYAIALLAEISYSFDRFGSMALKIAPLVMIWILGTSTLALFLDWKSVIRGKQTGLAISLGIFFLSAALLYGVLCLFLPAHPITQMRIQAYTAQGAYLKGIRYLLPMAAIFLCVPYHFVIAQQIELSQGHHRLSLALLTGQKWAITPRGSFFVTVRILCILLLLALLVSIPMASNLFSNLLPNPYMNLFSKLVQIQWILYFGLGVECVAWYARALNEVKRECLAVKLSDS